MPASRFTQTGNYRTTYAQDNSVFATHAELASFVVLLGAALVVPLVVPRTFVFTLDLILVYSIAVLGLNITTGYTGLINVGQAAFLGVGAYTVALLAARLGFPFYLAIPAGGAVGALFGAVVGLPSLRLKYLYLAIATLAFQVIFEWGVGHSPALEQGGAIGLPRPVVFGIEIARAQHNAFWYYVSLGVLVAMFLAWRNLLRSRFGRSLVAVRDNDRAADAMGINPGATKVMAFALGGLYAGVAGGLFAYLSRAVVIEDYTLPVSIKLLAMAIVGGLGSLPGSLLGPAFLELLDGAVGSLAGPVSRLLPAQAGVDVSSALRPLVFGLVIVLFLMFEPRGLTNFWRLARSYVRLWPFKH